MIMDFKILFILKTDLIFNYLPTVCVVSNSFGIYGINLMTALS